LWWRSQDCYFERIVSSDGRQKEPYFAF
ncbi:hypothetical protein A2U01_0093654, partial [Trifolium medium]|nr:hypothetical protein [Trifolium medium]